MRLDSFSQLNRNTLGFVCLHFFFKKTITKESSEILLIIFLGFILFNWGWIWLNYEFSPYEHTLVRKAKNPPTLNIIQVEC